MPGSLSCDEFRVVVNLVRFYLWRDKACLQEKFVMVCVFVLFSCPIFSSDLFPCLLVPLSDPVNFSQGLLQCVCLLFPSLLSVLLWSCLY